MPKLKSHSGAKKRFRKSISGKFMHRKAGHRHLLAHMSAKRGRQLKAVNVKDETTFEAKMLKAYLPYK
ncbi:MAG: 50S ribosomal protein L35 [Elusimicrobia bacterium RIFOXYB2_FULL_62_6]|nr:MAG: 50S ribosomal protein L35 [Elusimicrobia bacterium RIFOXYB2_FULL_62_6]